MITATEMTAKIEKEHERYRVLARDAAEQMFQHFDRAIEQDLLSSGLKGKPHAEITFVTSPLGDDLGLWCEIEIEKSGHNTFTAHHGIPIIVADYVKSLRNAGYQVSVCTSNIEICSKSGKTSYGNKEFRTLYVNF